MNRLIRIPPYPRTRFGTARLHQHLVLAEIVLLSPRHLVLFDRRRMEGR